jgi:hypothetical protein
MLTHVHTITNIHTHTPKDIEPDTYNYANAHAQVICAIAYDNTRMARKRWSGQRDPNGDDVTPWQRDHSNGDYASPQHCWRIVLQAPPSFVTDPTGSSTPFPKEWVSKYTSTTGQNSELFANVAVNGTRSVTFIAQDPNPRDRITIYVLEVPGVPRSMQVGESACVPRTLVAPMCTGTDMMDEGYPNVNLRSRVDTQRTSLCSRAKLTLTWSPPMEEAGRSYKVCAVARDDSPMCANIAQDATDRGWFGERQCVNFNVIAPVIRWKQPYEERFGARDAFVGCEMTFVAKAQDVSCRCEQSCMTPAHRRKPLRRTNRLGLSCFRLQRHGAILLLCLLFCTCLVSLTSRCWFVWQKQFT